MADRSGTPSCSVIIPTRARAGQLRQALASLAAQTGSDFEVITVCDGEDADTRRLAGELAPPFRINWIFLPERRGQASARNVGASLAHNDILLFMDDDMVARPTWILQHCSRHAADETGGLLAVCGRTVDVYPGPPRCHTERFLREQRQETCMRVEAGWSDHRPGDACDSIWHCFGVNCSIRRTTFLRHGGFDPNLDFVAEDMELGSRLAALGIHSSFEPSARLEHHDTKVLTEYLSECWRAGARADLYRVGVKKQYNAQTAALSMAVSRNPLRRVRVLAAWAAPALVLYFAGILRSTADATGSRLCFHLWESLCMSASYWREVRTSGYTPASVRQLVAAARRSAPLSVQPPPAPQVTSQTALEKQTSQIRQP
jgi:GT2 family glycosyltransferase